LTETEFVRVLPVADLPRGQMRCVEVAGQQVLLCATPDGVHAVAAVCTHASTRLDDGRLRGHRIVCPLHGARFDACTGAVLSGPATQPLQTFAARVADGHIEVRV
jgi:3-phenylpropionate/trans-cinnamate dioxygenase ferredoxin subunit